MLEDARIVAQTKTILQILWSLENRQKRTQNYLIPRFLQLKTKGHNEIKHPGPFPNGWLSELKSLTGLQTGRAAQRHLCFHKGDVLSQTENWNEDIYVSRKYQGFVISVRINLWLPSPSGMDHSQSVGRDVFLHAFQLLFWEAAAGRGFKLNRVSSDFLTTSFISVTKCRALRIPGMCSITEL